MSAYAKVTFQTVKLSCLILFFALIGCSYNETYAPVVNAWQDPTAMQSRYRVQKDDTIYSIAWSFDLDYRDLARANHLNPPYSLKPGQTLTMQTTDPGITREEKINDAESMSAMTYAAKDFQTTQSNPYQEVDVTPTVKIPKVITKKELQSSKTLLAETKPNSNVDLPELELKSIDYKLSEKKPPTNLKSDANIVVLPKKTVVLNQDKIMGQVSSGRWQWPARGRILKEFSLQTGGSKGIDIAGNLGDPVRAVAPGKVVYSGGGLRGYGNLVIIKHSDNYLSAYAYNKKLLVQEGDVVKTGAEIAKMGQNNSGDVLLHFEIRRNGKPVNPLLYL